MKKLIYLIVAISAGIISSCNPVDEIYDDLEANESPIVGDVTLTMSDDDYDELGKTFGNFNSSEEAKDLIPGLLTSKFPVLGLGSIAFVSFKVYAPRPSKKKLYRYTVTAEDYDANPETAQYDNFDDEDQIYAFLNTKYPNPVDRDLVSLTYKFYDGSVKTLNNGFFYTNGNWEFVQGFTDAEYELMGEGFPNFSSKDEAEVKIPIYLKDKFKYESKEAGDVEAIMYKLYTTDVDDVDGDGRVDDNTTISFIGYYIYDGANWSAYNNEIQETIQFANDGSTWVPDNTIKYTLGSADVAFISNAFIGIYPGPADNVGFFGSFDRRSSSSNFWSDDMLLEAFNALLDNINPNAEEGQKYVLTYVIYNGATGDETMSLIKTDGEWVLN